jgi:hypothetical protein
MIIPSFKNCSIVVNNNINIDNEQNLTKKLAIVESSIVNN